MAFPTSPTNGQQANINGITYTYSSAATAWTVSTSVSNTFVSINVSDNVNSGNVLATGLISATGNVSGSNLVVTGNIVDTGALTIVTGSNGNITLSPNGTGIVTTTGAISTTGNISANNSTFTSTQTLSYGTANGVVYLNGSKVATSGTALTFDGTNILSLAPGGAAIVNLGATTSYGVVTGTGTNAAAIYFNGATRTSFGSYLQYGATNHVFLNETLGSELMRIVNTGSVLMGDTTTIGTGGKLQVKSSTDTAIFKSTAATTYAAIVSNVENTAARLIAFQYGSGASPTNVGRITTDGTNIALATVSGITFPATQSASADANTLDDYEEGSWTPVLNFGGVAGVSVYSQQNGTYTKIGNVVTVRGYIAISSKSAATGAATLTGLPFVTKSGSSQYHTAYIYLSGVAITGAPMCYMDPNASLVNLGQSNGSTGFVTITQTNFSNGGDFIFQASYLTS